MFYVVQIPAFIHIYWYQDLPNKICIFDDLTLNGVLNDKHFNDLNTFCSELYENAVNFYKRFKRVLLV